MMANNSEIKFFSDGEPPKMSRSYIILDSSDNEIGGVEGYINEEGEFHTVIKINPEFQKRGVGFMAFQKVFEELNAVIEIQKIIGNWLLDVEEFPHCEDAKSTNLKIYWDCMKEANDVEKCCFQTPTGRWASILGFERCTVTKHSSKTVITKFFR